MEALILNTKTVREENKFQAAKVAITRRNGDLLILQRTLLDDYRPGGADIPGGEIEPGESALQAAIRETEEETTIVLSESRLKYVGTFTKQINEPGNPIKQIESTLYWAQEDDPFVDLRRNIEHQSFAWIAPEEALRRQIFSASISKTACLHMILDARSVTAEIAV
jgi:8-oxo-dGTP pyrophosphatase MutT (NUDIX family)